MIRQPAQLRKGSLEWFLDYFTFRRVQNLLTQEWDQKTVLRFTGQHESNNDLPLRIFTALYALHPLTGAKR